MYRARDISSSTYAGNGLEETYSSRVSKCSSKWFVFYHFAIYDTSQYSSKAEKGLLAEVSIVLVIHFFYSLEVADDTFTTLI